MTLRNLGICAVLAAVAANTGCVTHCHKTYQKSLEHSTEYALSPACRGQVHVFMLHGITPSTDCGLDALRLKLADNGFAKIGIGECYSGGWVESEIKCIRQNDPDARFVLIGYDYGGAAACSLARDLCGQRVPVDAVVLLDPCGCSAEPCGVRTLLITTATATTSVPHAGKIVVPDANHFSLPAHRTTVAVISDLLQGIAGANSQTPPEETPIWSYPHAPEARDPVNTPAGEWDFLADKPGGVRPIDTQAAARPAPKRVSPLSTPSGTVTLKR